MQTSIQLKEVLDEDECVQTILLIDEEGKTIADLSEEAGETITEAGIGKYFIEGMYTSWDDYESNALFDYRGKLLIKGIEEIGVYIEDTGHLFITVRTAECDYGMYSSEGVGGFSIPDSLFCVIDSRGRFVIEPRDEPIEYNEAAEVYISGDDVLLEYGSVDSDDAIIGRVYEIGGHSDEYLFFEKNQRIGIIRKGVALTDAHYQKIIAGRDGIFWVKDDSKWRVMSFSFRADKSFDVKSVDTDFDEAAVYRYSVLYLDKLHKEQKIFEVVYLVKKNDKLGLANYKGDVILPTIYEELRIERICLDFSNKPTDVIIAKVNKMEYKFGKIIQRKEDFFEIRDNDVSSLLFIKKIKKSYILLGQHAVKYLYPEPWQENLFEPDVFREFVQEHSGSYREKVISDLIRKQTVSSREGDFEFWYIRDTNSNEIIYIDANVIRNKERILYDLKVAKEAHEFAETQSEKNRFNILLADLEKELQELESRKKSNPKLTDAN